MAERGEELDPYLYPEQDKKPFLPLPLITVVDNDMMIKAMAASLTSTPTEPEKGMGKLYFPHSDIKTDHLDLSELPSPGSDMQASSTPLFKVMPVSAPAKLLAEKKSLCKTVSCPSFGSSFFKDDDDDLPFIGEEAASPRNMAEGRASPSSEPEMEGEDSSMMEGALYVVPKRKMRRYSKKDSLQRKRSKPIIPSPYPSPTHLMEDEGNAAEDKNVEMK